MRGSTMYRAIVSLAVLLGLPRPSMAADPVFDAKGFSPNREFASDLAFEHIDPLTGNLLLTFTDLVLPGNAGFDLRIQRTYNSKIYDAYTSAQTYALSPNDPAGLGWTLHFGKISNIASITPGPVVEMPDGSAHASFRHMDNNTEHFMTRDLWTLNMKEVQCQVGDTARCPLLRLPNGVRYVFAYGNRLSGPLYASDIFDPFGNSVHIEYETYQAGVPAYVQWVEQRFATGETRRVDFRYLAPLPGGGSVKRLSTIEFGTRVWTFSHQAAANRALLTSVQPPEGPAWTFAYHGAVWPHPHLMQRVTTPHGGTVSYAYQAQQFFYGSTVVYSPALSTRDTAGTDIAAGHWGYAFQQQAPYWNQPVVATVTEPCRTTTYETWAIGLQGDEKPWRIGAIKEKRISSGAASQTETYEWIASVPISPAPESGSSLQTHVPLLSRHSLSRDGVSYVTTNTYHASAWAATNNRSFNDYGQPERTDEAGPLSRTTTRTYFRPSASEFSLGTYIAGKVEVETVTVAGESFTRRNSYAAGNGFLQSEDKYGIVTTFTPDGGGNVKTRKDALQHSTTFTWQWGVPRTMQTPAYTITRVVDSDSTIKSQTRRGFTTRFEYDGLFRLELQDPPLGDPTTWTYATDGLTVTQRRGPSSTTSTLDGFGRVSATADSVLVRTDTSYDACGRTTYQSLPYTTANIGDQMQYDGLDRLRVRTHPDASFVSYAYSSTAGAALVTITDEESRVTRQVWKGFGDPADARLASVTDAAQQVTSYSYNALGSLTRVDAPTGPDRTWTYYDTGLLKTEEHPESGEVAFTYYSNGLLKTREDAAFGTTQFNYDSNNRLTLVDRPGTQPDTEIAYDGSDNRTFLRHGTIRSELGPYDGNDRLGKRVDTMAGQTFTTLFEYDNRDNLQQITYPSQGKAFYTFDSESRILSVTNGGSRTYADRFEYHASGGVSRYFSGNGIENRATFDPQRYWVTGTGSGSFMQFGYGHDRVGNVNGTTHVRTGDRTYNYSYTYGHDALDRLRSATTSSSQAWGNLSFDYDAIGNRKYKTATVPPNFRTDYVYGPGNRLTEATGSEAESFQYDGNGNQIQDGRGTYTYNADNMMATATMTGQVPITYGYDGDNLRKTKKVGDVVTYFVHGPGGQLLSEVERTASAPAIVKRDYIRAGSRLIASLRPPTLLVTPDSLVFAGVVGGTSPAPRSFSVSEASGGALSWQATETTSWLSVSPASGTTTPANVSVSVNTAGLAVGTHVGTIAVTSAGASGSPRQVTVRLVVTNQAGLVVMPSSLSFDMTADDENPDPQALSTLVSGGLDKPWTATTSASWITALPSSGTTPGTITVSVNGSGKRPGTHRGWVKVDAGTTPLSPRYVPITLVVRPGAGSVCDETAWFCEMFDEKLDGHLGGQGYWEPSEVSAQVVPDPRGSYKVAVLDPPPLLKTADIAPFPGDPPVEGSEISLQVMTEGVADDAKQVAKVEFFTIEGYAWGKTGRTFAAIRFGSALILQWGPNIYQELVHRMESGRWYDVRVVFQGGKIHAYVDGTLLFTTPITLPNGAPVQAFAMTGWDYPGAGYVDVIQGHGPGRGLVVDPQTLGFTGRTTPGGNGLTSSTSKAAQRVASAPMHFEPFPGTGGSPVRFVGRGGSYDVFLTSNDVVLSKPHAGDSATADVLRMKFPGGSAEPRVVPMDPLPGRSHYYLGSDPARWRTNVPHYARVRYEGVYPGVDVVFYGSPRHLEYDLVLAPGVDPSAVRIAFEGAEDLRLEGSEVVVRTAAGEMRQLKPLVYQEVAGSKRILDGEYVLHGLEVAFRVGDYDSDLPLVVDPVLVYSTYLGGSGSGAAFAVAADSDDGVYVTGVAVANFPTANPWQGTFGGGMSDAFITRFSPDGSTLIYSTFLGGTGAEHGAAIAVDAQENAFVVGLTDSFDFPRRSPIQPAMSGSNDGFIAKLDATGQVVLSSHLGGPALAPCFDLLTGVAVDGQGSTYVTGYNCGSGPFAWTPAVTYKVNQDYGWGASAGDAFVARVLPGPGRSTYLTFLNGPGDEWASGISADSEGNVYVGGQTDSLPPSDPVRNPFPASPGAFQVAKHGYRDLYVTKLGPDGTVVAYSTYLGGSDQNGNGGTDIALQPGCSANCAAFVASGTSSPDFPVTAGAFSTTLDGMTDATVIQVAPDGRSLVYSTYASGLLANSIAVDSAGAAHVGGLADPDSFPSASDCADRLVATPSGGTGNDAYYLKLNSAGSAVRSCALLGGSLDDRVYGLASSGIGSVFLAGGTGSDDFPTTEGAFETTGTGGAFVLRLADNTPSEPGMQFALPAYRVLEGDGEAVITVSRTGPLGSTASVFYRTSPGTAQPVLDYQHREGRLTFEAGESALAFTVPIVGDTTAESDETVNLTLSDAMGGDLGSPSQAVLTIGEDDGLSRTFAIMERGNPVGPVWWRVLKDMPWLTLNVTIGSGPKKVTATANPAGLAPGTYMGTLIVEADANDSPQFVQITFKVLP